MTDVASAPERGVFCNRTLNLRGIQAVGYDMDYTLLHYNVAEWEGEAFESVRAVLAERGWPVDGFEFDPGATIQGLVFDLQLGNLVKATRFGYVIQAYHGTRRLSYDEVRSAYGATVVDLAEDRFRFTNTNFSLSEESLFTQLVDLLDADALPGVMNYADLYRAMADALDQSHAVGDLKARILADPDRYLEPDPGVVPTLLDQRDAGKKLVLITNSEWSYTSAMMTHVVDPQLDEGTWRDLFDLVIVSAAKPRFFAGNEPAFEVVDTARSLLAPSFGPLESGRVYFGGNARLVEQSLGLSGGDFLYVGDHLWGDVHVLKTRLGWRTCLILRELEAEISDAVDFADDQQELLRLMDAKAEVEQRLAALRTERLHARRRGEPAPAHYGRDLERAKSQMIALDADIAPLVRAASRIGNAIWGPLMRAGSDKSLFARQVERHADVYTSRVSNLGFQTPYGYLRASRGSLPHDLPDINGGAAGPPAD
ncbi:MAG: HAD-IG family 5'-nucleotidase [Acidimicrobiales bacterium]